MYLTRFRFNTARDGARRLLSSPQSMHAAVLSAFAEPPTSVGGPRVLWRVDHNSATDVQLYMSSPDRPDLTHLVEQAGWPTIDDGWETRDYGAFLARLTNGAVWDFRLTANPIHYARRNDDEPTKRTAHLTWRHQKAWLIKYQEKAGFAVMEKPIEQRAFSEGDEHELIVHSGRRLSFTKRTSPSPARPVTLSTVTYDGRLRITNAVILRRALTAGLGKARAYGCGLMTLAQAG